MRTPGCWEATCCWCVHSSVSNAAPHWVCFKPLPRPCKAAVFHVSEPCNSLSRIQTLQQSSIYHVSKPCSSLSRIKTLQQSITYPSLAAVFHVSRSLQQSFRYPNFSGSSLEYVPQVRQITDFKLCYTKNTHYDSVVALDGDLFMRLFCLHPPGAHWAHKGACNSNTA